MKLWSEIRARLFSVLAPVVTVALLFYFGYHALEGNHGLKAWLQYQGEKAILAEKAKLIRAERQALEQKVALFKPDNMDPDLLAEEVRNILGYTHTDEVVIYTRPSGQGETKTAP
jgi:cell division protein FtsB